MVKTANFGIEAGPNFSKSEWLPAFSPIRNEFITSKIIRRGFQATRIHPLQPNTVLKRLAKVVSTTAPYISIDSGIPTTPITTHITTAFFHRYTTYTSFPTDYSVLRSKNIHFTLIQTGTPLDHDAREYIRCSSSASERLFAQFHFTTTRFRSSGNDRGSKGREILETDRNNG